MATPNFYQNDQPGKWSRYSGKLPGYGLPNFGIEDILKHYSGRDFTLNLYMREGSHLYIYCEDGNVTVTIVVDASADPRSVPTMWVGHLPYWLEKFTKWEL